MDHNFRVLINSRKLFFGTMVLLLITAVLSLFFFGNTAGYFSPEINHPFWLNVFFINYTFMSDGIFVLSLAVLLIFWFKRKRQGMMFFYAFLVSEILVQSIYNLGNHPGFGLLFEEGQYLFSLEGGRNGFISGHTAIAFALVTALVLSVKNAKWQLPLLLAALVLAFSRMYLANHFLLDILVGAVIGIFAGITAVYFSYYFKWEYYFKKISQNSNMPASTGRNIQPV